MDARPSKFVGRRRLAQAESSKELSLHHSSQKVGSSIPEHISENKSLQDFISHHLPSNYNFEIYKSLWRIECSKATKVALQLPEGLMMFALPLVDIFERFGKVKVVILGDVTYGACCIDDYTARTLGCDFMIHYGHSCLVPLDPSKIECLYVFVDIAFDLKHLEDTVRFNFKKSTRIAIFATIQFVSSLQSLISRLEDDYVLTVPQADPLSAGEVLGCTCPPIEDCDLVLYLGDGRFHLEAIMTTHPDLPAYRYDPYSKEFTIEKYNFTEMMKTRLSAINRAASAKTWGIVVGTLGRQGSPLLVDHLEKVLKENNRDYIVVLMSEVFPAKLKLFEEVDAWVQVCCPRLSMDWGYVYEKPLLNAYEFQVALKTVPWKDIYPLDNYAHAGGEWSVGHHHHPSRYAKAHPPRHVAVVPEDDNTS